MKTVIVPFDPQKGYPYGKDLFYECGNCGEMLPSKPHDYIECKCRNIRIDTDAGRIAVENNAKIILHREIIDNDKGA